MSTLRIGVDTGGTFTDFVTVQDGILRAFKLPSTPDNPAEAVVQGLERLLSGATEDNEVVHGSTVATNALLERRGAATALVTTAGFEDLLLIGRQSRRDIYDIDVGRVEPLVPRDRCLGVGERVAYDGEVLEPLEADALDGLLKQLAGLDIDAVAICLLNSYANADHERAILAAIRQRFDVFVCMSGDVLPEFREYERCSTTVINAYVGPVMSAYLDDLAQRAGARRLHVLQSNGGAMTVGAARQHAVHTILSGPAGGVVGGFELAQQAGFDQVITFDMGGTSTDVSLCPGSPTRTNESSIGDLPVRVPVLDIHTVGAGGGSIAEVDPGGALRVGPRSAGAVPGPVCYARGGSEVTVTDANLYLGRLSPAHFLGGEAGLDAEAARSAVERLAERLEMAPVALAEGIVEVANATMAGAVRVISVERGHDPRDFTLVCFGGAGGMHAVDLASALSIPRVIVPPEPGTLSALGMLLADAVRDYSQTVLCSIEDATSERLEVAYRELESLALQDELVRESRSQPELTRSIDLRYRGQGYEINVPYDAGFVAAFHAAHGQRFGYSDRERATEVVTLRVQARIPTASSPPQFDNGGSGANAAPREHPMVFGGVTLPGILLARSDLATGVPIAGPALIVEYGSTTVLPPGWHGALDVAGNLLLQPASVA